MSLNGRNVERAQGRCRSHFLTSRVFAVTYFNSDERQKVLLQFVVMGGEESLPQRRGHDPGSPYLHIGHRHSRHNIRSLPVKLDPDCVGPDKQRRLPKPGFECVWSLRYPESLSPTSRIAHFSSFSEDYQKLFIGYGEDFTGTLLSDIWEFDLNTGCWTRLEIEGGELEPRRGCSGYVFGNHLLVFGGETAAGYVSDLHVIDLNTLSLVVLDADGPAPPPMIGAVIALVENRIFVWGGFNGAPQDSLYILDTLRMEWRRVNTSIPGRYSIPWCVIGDKIYAYGGSKEATLVVIDMTLESVTEVTCTGAPPPADAHGAGMCRFDNNLVYFGGQARSKWSLVYCLDIRRRWWFVLHVAPDGETVGISDGNVSEYGLFMVPRTHQFAVGYSRDARTIVATLGFPMREPPPLFLLDMRDAISVIHMRDDMLAILKATNSHTHSTISVANLRVQPV